MIEICIDLSWSFGDVIFEDLGDDAEVGFGLLHFIAWLEVRSSFFEHDLFHLFIESRIVLFSPPHELMDSIDELLLGLDSFCLEICCQVR